MKYINKALEMGATSAVKFQINDICFDSRVALKCIFGCASYGKHHTCPYQKSHLSMDEYKEMFGRYTWGVIIGCKDVKTSQNISYEIEKEAFFDGYYFAFSLSDCHICKSCAKIENKECRSPEKARPAFHSVGIDVFKTVKKFNLPLYVLQDDNSEQNWYSAVFIE